MAEMNRNRDQQNQGNNRQSHQGEDQNRDMQGGRRREHEPSTPQWDGHDRRTGAERRNGAGSMVMNEGSSR